MMPPGPVQVAVADSYGNQLITSGVSITLSLGSNPGEYFLDPCHRLDRERRRDFFQSQFEWRGGVAIRLHARCRGFRIQ